MNPPAAPRPPSPRHYIQPKSVWNDKKGRTIICLDIWESQQGYTIDLLVLLGNEKFSFEVRPWLDIFEAISTGKLIRNSTEEFKYLKARSKL